jgi:hypothetical protein
MTRIAGPVDFETGDTSQFSSVEPNAAAWSVIAGAAYEGSYGGAVTLNEASDTSAEGEGRLTFDAPGTNVAVLELWFRWASFTQGGYGTEISKSVAYLGPDFSEDMTERAAWLIVTSSGQLRLVIRRADGTQAFVGDPVSLTVGTWYRIRLVVDRSGAQPVAFWALSTDGSTFTTQASATDTTSGPNGLGRDMRQGRAGAVHVGQFEKADYTSHVDRVEIHDAIPSSASTYTEAGQGTAIAAATAADTLATSAAGQATSSAAGAALDAAGATENGAGAAGSTSGGLDTLSAAESGTGAVTGGAAGLDALTTSAAGQATSSASAGGLDILTTAAAGQGTSAAAGAGADSYNGANVYTETGGAAAGASSAGADTLRTSEAGQAAASGSSAGATTLRMTDAGGGLLPAAAHGLDLWGTPNTARPLATVAVRGPAATITSRAPVGRISIA